MNNSICAINIVVDLLKKHNIKHIVISPGGTNIGFVRAVQNDSFFSCYSVVDERSAMYFAIGIYLKTGEAVATSCTSAQATRNYIPGLTEAFYKHVPILAITMSKHPRFIGQEYMQAPNQISLPTDCVKKSFMVPYVETADDKLFCSRVVNEAILCMSNNGLGPVQLCVPWLDFELEPVEIENKVISRYTHSTFARSLLNDKRIMIVVGEHRPFEWDEASAMEAFAEGYDCVVYVNHLSNYHGKYSISANYEFLTMKEEDFIKTYKPDIIISIGGQTGDYPLYKMLSKLKVNNVEHWRVSLDGEVVDTYDKLTKIYQMDTVDFFKELASEATVEHSYFKKWSSLINERDINIEIPLSNAYLAQKLSPVIPQGSTIQFSILNSLRIWDLFKLDDSVTCFSNVGAFGIDGGLSTLIGQSVVTNELCFMVIGDLAFFYDMNSIGNRHIKNNLRILIINNNGGIEFKLNGGQNKETDRFIAAANHFANAKGWAETCGFSYMSAESKAEVDNQIEKFISMSEKPIVFEIFATDNDESTAYKRLIGSEGFSIKSFIKNHIIQ